MEDKKIGKYELGYLLAKEEDVQVVMKHLADSSAELGVKGDLKQLSLSYQIKKHGKAYFGWVRFTMPTESAPALVNALRLDARVLRTILIADPYEQEAREESAAPRAKTRKPAAKEMSNEALEEQLASLKGEGK